MLYPPPPVDPGAHRLVTLGPLARARYVRARSLADIEIEKGTPMLQYVPAVLPSLKIHEAPMQTDLADYLVMLSKMHKGGDMRLTKENDVGAYDVMKSYQLKENPGYYQHHKTRKPRKNEL